MANTDVDAMAVPAGRPSGSIWASRNPLLKAAACVMEHAQPGSSDILEDLNWDPLQFCGGAGAQNAEPQVYVPTDLLQMINPGLALGSRAAAQATEATPTQKRALRKLQQRRETRETAAAAAAAEEAARASERLVEAPLDESWIDEIDRSPHKESVSKAAKRRDKKKQKSATQAAPDVARASDADDAAEDAVEVPEAEGQSDSVPGAVSSSSFALLDEEEQRKLQDRAERKAKERSERRAKEQAERLEREEVERKAKEEAERRAKDDVARRAKEDAERRAKEHGERKAKEQERRAKEEERRAKEEAERRAKEEAERKAKEQAEREAKELERRVKQEAERAVKKAAERRAAEEADSDRRAREARDEAKRKAREEAEKRAVEARAKIEAARKAREDAERKARELEAEEEAARKALEEATRCAQDFDGQSDGEAADWAPAASPVAAPPVVLPSAKGTPAAKEKDKAEKDKAEKAEVPKVTSSFAADAPEFVPFSMMVPREERRERGRRGRRKGSAGELSSETDEQQSLPITTVVISNIPGHHTPDSFREQLDAWGLTGTYDFFYMPSEHDRMGSGYAFVNFIDPTFATFCQWLFLQYEIEGTAAPFHVQGLESNISHWSQHGGGDSMTNAPLIIQSPSPSQWAVNGVNMMLNSKFSPQIREQFHKTKMCVFHKKNKCALGSGCPFAHSPKELQAVPDLAKTKLCYNFFRQKCNDSRCKFAHGYQELRATEGVYKTELCRWWGSGSCKAGDSCRYAHGVEQLRMQAQWPMGDMGDAMPFMPTMQDYTKAGMVDYVDYSDGVAEVESSAGRLAAASGFGRREVAGADGDPGDFPKGFRGPHRRSQ